MNDYVYADASKAKLVIAPSTHHKAAFVAIAEHGPQQAAFIANADVPTVAAELLKAAGIEATILPKTTEEVVERDKHWVVCGNDEGYAADLLEADPVLIRRRAANCIALAEFIESKAAREADAEVKLQERRDALMGEFFGRRYMEATPAVRNIVDHVISLENQATP